MIAIFDFEVVKHDWLVVTKDTETGEYRVFHNDNDGVSAYLEEYKPVLAGFNNKHYDNFILRAVLAGFTPEAVKGVNDWIIDGNEGWACPSLQDVQTPRFDSFDLRDDCENGLSLKAFEGHMGMDITESSVPFDIDRALTPEELDEMTHYCKADVDATHELLKIRRGYIQGKLNVGRMGNIPDTKAVYCTNAKLTALFLGAKMQEHHDEREYVWPDNLLREWIPQEVADFFGRMKDERISDEDLFGEKLEFEIGGTPTVVGFGGIHAAIPNFRWKKTEWQIISNFDVASYYPSLMIVNGYASRNLPSFEKYKEIYETRIAAKRSGDKATANTLKLVLNSTYGATLNAYNDLYDPLMARSVCISGQLYLLELAEHLLHECKTLRIVQLNTDGIMILYNDTERQTVLDLTDEWQKRTGFGLEEDQIVSISQKDVNNYVMLDSREHEKLKGGYVVRGVLTNGKIDFPVIGYPDWQNIGGSAFKINNNACVVAKAVKDFLLYGIPAKETIEECKDVFQFQMIAKAGSGYDRVFHTADGKEIEVNRVNRVYATADERFGTLYKVKRENGQIAKIAGVPEHCIVSNDNSAALEDVDKRFYIDLAEKQINDYLGIKPKKERKKMAAAKTTTEKPTMTLLEKLLEARVRFMESGVQKSGKNLYMKYKYFTLDDIVPVANRIFRELGLIALVDFVKTEDGGTATMDIWDVRDAEKGGDSIRFTVPMPALGKMDQLTPVQELGANITYLRRYLYMLALDITEVDITDEGLADRPAAKPAQKTEEKPKAPPTAEKREEIKRELTDVQGEATEMQKRRLEKALMRLLEVKPDMKETVADLLKTTENFQKITKEQAESLLIEIGKLVEG